MARPVTPLSGVIERLTVLGFLGFFVFMLSMGISMLRRRGVPERTDLHHSEISGPTGG
jgi:hypothetical protein